MSARTGLTLASCLLGGTYWASMSSQSQLLGSFPRYGSTDRLGRPRLALTFDDGPNEPFTSRLTELLERRGVRATFFQVGRAVARQPESTGALFAAGHVIGNHSYSHRLARCVDEMSINDEMERTQDVLSDVIGARPRLYRPPWLIRTPATFRALRRQRLHVVSGTFCHPLEVAQCASGRIAARAVSRARPERMMIFHDGYNGQAADRRQTLDAVARTIDTLAERGWVFSTVDEVLGIEAYEVSPTLS